MLHGTISRPVDITYVKKHDACFGPMKDCLFIDYIIRHTSAIHVTCSRPI